jgi:HNH endonuclease
MFGVEMKTMYQEQNGSELTQDNWYSSDEYQNAIIKLEKSITPLHRRMLVAHAEAPDCMLSVRQIAAAGGYEKSNVTYSQYGRLGRFIAVSLGVTEQWKVWTHFIGVGFRTETNELIWEMHPELVDALVKLNWATRPTPDSWFDNEMNSDANDGPCESETEREAFVQARVGQGPFRIALLKYWGSCAVTGVSEPAALRASHIKSWRSSSNQERLNPFNGLLLSAHIDALFDKGLITFELDGHIRLSPLLAQEDLRLLGITPTMRLRRVAVEHQEYLHFHHKEFRSGKLAVT